MVFITLTFGSPVDMSPKSFVRDHLHQTQIGGHEVTTWDHWPLYLNPSLTEAMLESIEDLIADRRGHFDYLFPASWEGTILTTCLAQRLQKPLLNYRLGAGILGRKAVHKEARVLLVDTQINTGRSLCFALGALESICPRLVDLVIIIYHDIYPSEFTMPIKIQWFKEGKIAYLYKMSDLL